MKNRIYIVVLWALLIVAGKTVFAQPDSVAKAVLLLQGANASGNIDKSVVIGTDANTIQKKYGRPKSINTTVIKNNTLEQWVYNNGYVYFDNGKVDSYQLSNADNTPVSGITMEAAVKQALETIDRAIKDPQSAKSAYAWYVRGYVYKEWYKAFESSNKKSKTRIDAVSYFRKALELDTAKEYVANIKQTLKYLGSTFYNDASASLDATNYQTAIEDFAKFKECMLLAEPNYNLRKSEIDFKTVLADQYAIIFKRDMKQNLEFLSRSEITYKEVIALDTNNKSATLNLAFLYYNYGVDIINNMSVESDIIVIENIQEEAKAQFKKALPYALKTYALDPKDPRVLRCLQGIYFSLYEFEKSDEFKAKLELIEKEKEK